MKGFLLVLVLGFLAVDAQAEYCRNGSCGNGAGVFLIQPQPTFSNIVARWEPYYQNQTLFVRGFNDNNQQITTLQVGHLANGQLYDLNSNQVLKNSLPAVRQWYTNNIHLFSDPNHWLRRSFAYHNWAWPGNETGTITTPSNGWARGNAVPQPAQPPQAGTSTTPAPPVPQPPANTVVTPAQSSQAPRTPVAQPPKRAETPPPPEPQPPTEAPVPPARGVAPTTTKRVPAQVGAEHAAPTVPPVKEETRAVDARGIYQVWQGQFKSANKTSLNNTWFLNQIFDDNGKTTSHTVRGIKCVNQDDKDTSESKDYRLIFKREKNGALKVAFADDASMKMGKAVWYNTKFDNDALQFGNPKATFTIGKEGFSTSVSNEKLGTIRFDPKIGFQVSMNTDEGHAFCRVPAIKAGEASPTPGMGMCQGAGSKANVVVAPVPVKDSVTQAGGEGETQVVQVADGDSGVTETVSLQQQSSAPGGYSHARLTDGNYGLPYAGPASPGYAGFPVATYR